ncbi:MAG: carboxypeptidase regulatory-like domain-containing protein, partial [Chloroflexi bacterium]|nr:carboxypeptidase regulatory-like domain-containing protein [Chloroflexota bacterium]
EGTPTTPTQTPTEGTPTTPTQTPTEGTPTTPTVTGTPTEGTPTTPTTPTVTGTPTEGTPTTPTQTPTEGTPTTPTVTGTPTEGTPTTPTQTPTEGTPTTPTQTPTEGTPTTPTTPTVTGTPTEGTPTTPTSTPTVTGTPPILLSLGNRVWEDLDNDGRQEAGESGIGGVTVRLFADTNGDGTPDGPALATTTTNANGFYLFSNLSPGTYIVEISPPSGYTSSTGAPGSATGPFEGPDTPQVNAVPVDQDDNGTTVGDGIRTKPFTLQPGQAPTGETDLPSPNPDAGTPDANSDQTVDFGLFVPYSLGNRVWLDSGAGGGVADNGVQDGTEPGVSGVTVRLYNGSGTTLLATTTTDANGHYRFDKLPAGNYVVEIAASNFSGGPLAGYVSSSVDEVDPNDDIDRNDNGLGITPSPTNGIRSGVVTLGPGLSEPIGETDLAATDQGTVDARANMTVDFGFVVSAPTTPTPTPAPGTPTTTPTPDTRTPTRTPTPRDDSKTPTPTPSEGTGEAVGTPVATETPVATATPEAMVTPISETLPLTGGPVVVVPERLPPTGAGAMAAWPAGLILLVAMLVTVGWRRRR